jgi:phytoene dehydrogenase-like protein
MDDPANRMSFRDWLKQYTDDEKVLQLFRALTSAISTVNDFEYPASHWFTYVSPAGQDGMAFHGISPRGNVENANSLWDAIGRKDGDVWLNALVTRIVVAGGRVKGLVVRRNDREVEVETTTLISNIGPRDTVQLAGREHFPPEYLKDVDSLRSAPIVANLIASDRLLIDVPGGLLIIGAKRIVAGAPMTKHCPELAPTGQHLTVVWGTPASCSQHMDFNEEARLNLEDIKTVFPDFEKHGRLLRQDIRDIDDEFPALRSWMGYDIPQKTPIPNLWNVGDAVKPFGWEGTSAAAQSARIVVNEVRKQFKPA